MEDQTDIAATTAMSEMRDVLGFAQQTLKEQALTAEAMEADQPLGRRPRQSEDSERWTKWQKPGGKGQSSWDPWSQTDWIRDQEKDQAQGTVDIPTQRLLTAMVKLAIRHEEELAKIRIDTTYFVYLDTGHGSIIPLIRSAAEVWNKQCEEGKVTTPLRIVLLMLVFQEAVNRIDRLVSDEARRTQAKQHGWIEDGPTEVEPLWTFFQWNPTLQRQERSQLPPLKHNEVKRHLDVVLQNLGIEGALTKFKSLRKMSRTDRYASAVLPFMVNLSLRSEAATRCYQSLMVLVGNSALKAIGMRHRPERGHRQPQTQVVEQAYLAVPYTEWAERTQPPRRRNNAAAAQEEQKPT